MRRSLLAVLVAAGALSGCSDAQPLGAPTSPPSSSVEAAASTDAGVDLPVVSPAVWGDGRAIDAVRNVATGDLFIATTTGVVAYTNDGQHHRLPGDMAPVPGTLAVSSTADRVGVAAGDGTVYVWDASTYEPSLTLEADGAVSALAFGADDRLSVIRPTTITTYDAAGISEVIAESAEVFGDPALDAGVIAVPDVVGPAPRILIEAADATLRQIDLAVDGPIEFSGVRLTNAGQRLIATWWAFEPSDTVAVWDTTTGALLQTAKVPFSVEPGQVTLTADDELLIGAGNAVTSADGSVTLTSLPPERSIDQIWTLDNDRVLIGDIAGGIWASDLADQATELDTSGVRNVSRTLDLSSNELVGVDANGRIRLIDVGANTSQALSEYEAGAVTGVEFIGGSNDIVVTRSTGRADTITAVGTEPLYVQDSPLAGLATAKHGDLVALGTTAQLDEEAWDDSITVVSLAGEPVADVGGEGERVPGCVSFRSRVEFAPDGSFIAANSHDFSVQVTDLQNGETTTLEAALGPVFDIAVSPDASRLAASSEDSTLRIWSDPGTSPELIARFESPIGGYHALGFSPNGTAIAASDITGAIVLIDPNSGQTIETLEGSKSPDVDLVFTPDGRFLVSGDDTGDVIIWSIADRAIVARLSGHAGAVTDVAVRADGRAVVSGSVDGTVRVWPLQLD